MMSEKNIKRRDFTKLAIPLLAMFTASGLVATDSSGEGRELKISPQMAKSIASLAQDINRNLGTAASKIVSLSRINSLKNRSIDLATLRSRISESIAWDYDNNRVCTVNGIVMSNTEIAVVLKLDKIIVNHKFTWELL